MPPDAHQLANAFSTFQVPELPLAAYVHEATARLVAPRAHARGGSLKTVHSGEYFRRLNDDVVATSTRVSSPLMIGHMVRPPPLSQTPPRPFFSS